MTEKALFQQARSTADYGRRTPPPLRCRGDKK
jgi:hypothetical protein